MSNKEMAQIPYYAHEGEVTRLERINKRLWIAVLIVFAAFVISNLAWIIYENQFEDIVTTETYTSDATGGGVAVSNGEGGVTIYGNGGAYEDSSPQSTESE